METLKVGDCVKVLKGQYGHIEGDIGIIRSIQDDFCRVEVEGRKSTSCWAPCVSHYKSELEKVILSDINNSYEIY